MSHRKIGAGVIALVTGTWYFTRTPPPVKAHDPVTVVIAEFSNNTGDPTFDHTLEPMLRLSLEGAGFISAYDRSRIRSAFGTKAPDRLDEEAARRIAMKQGVGFVLTGSIDRRGDGYDVSVKAAQPISGNVTAQTKARASNKDETLGMKDQLISVDAVHQPVGACPTGQRAWTSTRSPSLKTTSIFLSDKERVTTPMPNCRWSTTCSSSNVTFGA